jgi:hypothetical protein
MYPITCEEVRSGYVKGKERLVTIHSGLYGWDGNTDIHLAHLYDGRGYEVPNGFMTTVDTSGIRTQAGLARNEICVIEKIPVSIKPAFPI